VPAIPVFTCPRDPQQIAYATRYNLLQRAVSKGLVRVPWDDQQNEIKRITAVRNTLLHLPVEVAVRGFAAARFPGEQPAG